MPSSGFLDRRRSREDRSRELENSRDRKFRISELVQKQNRTHTTSEYTKIRTRQESHRYSTFEEEEAPMPESINLHRDSDNLVIYKRVNEGMGSPAERTSGMKTSSVTPLRRKVYKGEYS
jgi:hypothetical protein